MENRGYIISGVGHVGLILWVLLGGWFWQSHPNPAVSVANVSLISPEQLQALDAAASAPPKAPQTKVAPPKPMAPATSPAPRPEPTPEPTPPAAPPPEMAPKPQPKPEAQDARPQPDVAPAPPPSPPAPKLSEKPQTRKIDRVAPTPAPKSEAKAAPKKQEAVQPNEAQKTPAPEKPKEAAAPKEAATRIATEENTAKENAAPLSLAPAASPRPMRRPQQMASAVPVPPAKPETPKPETPKPEKPKPEKPAKTQESAVNDAVAAALASAVADGQGKTKGKLGNGTADEGPPLTSAEKEGLTLAVQKCWYVDVGSAAADITVTLGFSLNPDGTVMSGSVHQISTTKGTADAQRAAYDAARRAVLVCGADGYKLPTAKYAQWKTVEVTFNPAQMRSR
jgi:chemotaxis protein histidine kinase CheA